MEHQGVELIKQLEIFRLENRFSQQAMAKRLGVAFSTVNRWLNGKSAPNKIQMFHINKLLNGKASASQLLADIERK